MVLDHVEKTACFQGKSLEFLADWLEKNNLSKLKSVFEGTFIIPREAEEGRRPSKRSEVYKFVAWGSREDR